MDLAVALRGLGHGLAVEGRDKSILSTVDEQNGNHRMPYGFDRGSVGKAEPGDLLCQERLIKAKRMKGEQENYTFYQCPIKKKIFSEELRLKFSLIYFWLFFLFFQNESS